VADRATDAHLLPYGWDTVVIDIDWSNPTARPHGHNDNAPSTSTGD
jgi:alpha-galactosidase